VNIEQVFGGLSIEWVIPVSPRLINNGITFLIEDNSEEMYNPLQFTTV